jgi:hypothetical protein
VTLTLALAQVNPTSATSPATPPSCAATRDQAALGADLVVFPELVLVGYPPEDLVLRPAVVEAAATSSASWSARARPEAPGCSSPSRGARRADASTTRPRSWPTAVELPLQARAAELRRVRREAPLHAGPAARSGPLPRRRLGSPSARTSGSRRSACTWPMRGGVLLGSQRLAVRGGQVRAAPRSRPRPRAESGLPVAYVNQVGGQDELVFDGGSFVMKADGALAATLPFWREALAVTRWTREDGRLRCDTTATWTDEPRLASIYHAMMLGLRDYVEKNRFPGVLIGLSGGIDSALTAAVAVDALGPRACAASACPPASRARPAWTTPLETAACSASGSTRCRSRRASAPSSDGGTALRRTAARHHRGEPPGARAGRAADGALQQVRRAARDDRQQVGDVGGLLDALRRHVRRLLGAQGHLQDRGLRARAVAQRSPPRGEPWGRPGARSRVVHHEGAHGRAAAEPDRPGLAAPLRRARRHPDGARRGRAGRARDRGARLPARHGAARAAHALHGRVQAAAGAAGRQDHPPQLRPRPALPDDQRVPRDE